MAGYVPGQGAGGAAVAAPSAGTAPDDTRPTGALDNPFSQGDFNVTVSHQTDAQRAASALSEVGSVWGGADPTSANKKSAAALVNSLVGMTPQQMLALQDRLIAAGLLSRGGRTAVADSDTRKAYAQLLHETSVYNAGGQDVTPDELLQRSIDVKNAEAASKAAIKAAQGADGKSGNVTVKANPLDLEGQVQQAAQDRLGRKLKPAEVAKFVSIYQHMQTVDDKQTFAAGQAAQATAGGSAPDGTAVPGVNGTSSTLPGLASQGAAADQFIDHGYAQEAAGQQAVNYYDVIRKSIGGI